MSLVVENVVAGYTPELNILNGISIRVKKGEITCVIGPNGAGKSTLLKTIYGFLKPGQGRILWDREDITGTSPHEMSLKGIGYLFQRRHIFVNLTVHENLKIGTWTFRWDKEEVMKRINEVYDRFPILNDKKNERAKTLSGGQQRMLELGRLLIGHPKIILVDEPTSGLAPKVAMGLYRELEKLKDEGISILMVDQNVKQAISLANEVYVIKGGQVTVKGTSERFKKNLPSLMSEWLI